MIICLDEEWSTYKKLLFLKAMGGGANEYEIKGNPVSFATNLAKPLSGFTIPFLPVQSGTGDPSPENIRPITGWTGLTAYRTGKNLIPNKKVLSGNTIQLGVDIYSALDAHSVTLQPGTYTLSVNTFDNNPTNLYVAKIGVAEYLFRAINAKSLTFTISEKTDLRIWVYKVGYEDVGVGAITSFQLELGSTATPYTSYTGASYPVTFGQTVYGGTLDAVNGVLTVTHAMWTKNTADMDSTAEDYPGWLLCGIKDIVGSGLNATLTVFSNIGTKVGVNTRNVTDTLFLSKAIYGKTKEEWISLAIDVQVVAELATPIEIQLDPITVQTLIGDNTIWTDTNGENTIKYKKKG